MTSSCRRMYHIWMQPGPIDPIATSIRSFYTLVFPILVGMTCLVLNPTITFEISISTRRLRVNRDKCWSGRKACVTISDVGKCCSCDTVCDAICIPTENRLLKTPTCLDATTPILQRAQHVPNDTTLQSMYKVHVGTSAL